ncbi:MAG: ABC transporter substrate-binding protein [Caldiserica bacterium]|nr:ABC transporter substrate-binding protein [Caldisericota bacterium]
MRVSLTPILGSAPVLYAVEWGTFAAEGLQVELIPLASQRDRIFAFQAGQVDAMITDVASVILLAARGDPVVVATAYVPEDPRNQFSVLVQAKYSGVDTMDDLVALLGSRNFFRIALPLQSDIEFATDTALRARGFEPDPRIYFGQDNLFIMASMVVYGMVAAAVLPEPYASFSRKFAEAEGFGLTALEDFAGVPPLPHLIVFQRDLVEGEPGVVRAFLRAFAAAADRMNRESKEGLLTLGAPEVLRLFYQGMDPEQVLSHPSVQAAIAAVAVPRFPAPGPLDRGIYEQVLRWALAKGYVRLEHPYEEVVTGEFVE